MNVLRAPIVSRTLLYLLAFGMALWVIVPVYFITIGAFSTPDSVYAYPRELWPHHLSTATLRFFLHSDGVIPALERSVWVAAITLGFSLAVGTPATLCIPWRRCIPSDDRLDTRLPDRDPGDPALGHLHSLGDRRQRARRRNRAHRARPPVRCFDDLECVRRDLG